MFNYANHIRIVLSAGTAAVFLAACASNGMQGSLAPPASSAQSVASNTTADAMTGLLASSKSSHRVPDLHPDNGPSWMAPDLENTRLLYIADQGTNDVYVYSYRTAVLKGKITKLNMPYGMCADRIGRVWVTEYGAGDIKEYAHGLTRLVKTLTTGGNPIGCAVDPHSGDLAVSLYKNGSQGAVLVYAHAAGTPAQYLDTSVANFWPPTYDNQGNLYAETRIGGSGSTMFGLDELVSGGPGLHPVTLGFTIGFAGGAAWDGKYVALDDQSYPGQASALYQVTISSYAATLIGTTVLATKGCTVDVTQPWIPKLGSGRTNPQGMKVVGGNDFCPSVMFWNYPSAGAPTKTITNNFQDPAGATVSRGVLEK